MFVPMTQHVTWHGANTIPLVFTLAPLSMGHVDSFDKALKWEGKTDSSPAWGYSVKGKRWRVEEERQLRDLRADGKLGLRLLQG